jgi:hypothetical protein
MSLNTVRRKHVHLRHHKLRSLPSECVKRRLASSKSWKILQTCFITDNETLKISDDAIESLLYNEIILLNDCVHIISNVSRTQRKKDVAHVELLVTREIRQKHASLATADMPACHGFKETQIKSKSTSASCSIAQRQPLRSTDTTMSHQA